MDCTLTGYRGIRLEKQRNCRRDKTSDGINRTRATVNLFRGCSPRQRGIAKDLEEFESALCWSRSPGFLLDFLSSPIAFPLTRLRKDCQTLLAPIFHAQNLHRRWITPGDLNKLGNFRRLKSPSIHFLSLYFGEISIIPFVSYI